MFTRQPLMVRVTLIALIATAIMIKPQETESALPELASSLHELVDKKEQKPANFTPTEINLSPPCECSANDLKRALSPFNGPDPPFLPAYIGGKA